MNVRRSEGRVFVISGPSGGGKTTVVQQLRRKLPRLLRSVSVTTRRPRRGERHGRDYQFISLPTFRRLRRTRQLLEWARVHEAYYGTPRRPIERALAAGRRVVLSIDVQGARQIRRALRTQSILIFLLPPSMRRLRQRLIRRKTETPDAIRQRLTAAQRELACAAWYDHTVVNDRLDQTVAALEAIIRETGRSATRSSSAGTASRRVPVTQAGQHRG